MAIEQLLDGLRQRLSAPEAARVIAALRRDALVWAALKESALSEKALEVCGDQAHLWTPAVLSLVALGEDSVIETVAVEPMKALEAGLRQQAVHLYESIRKKGAAPADLREAGLLGLALRERRRLTGSWNGLSGELLTAPSGARSISAGTWKTPLACLAGFIPNLNELVGSLVTCDSGSAGLEWLVHILLTQTLDAEEQAQRIVQAVRGLPIDKQLDLLKALRMKGMADVVEKSANLLLTGQPRLANLAENAERTGITMAGLADQTMLYQQLAAFHQLGGNPAQADQALQAAQGLLKTIQAGLELQAGDLERLDCEGAWLDQASLALPPASKRVKQMMKQVGLAVNSGSPDQQVVINPSLKDNDPFLMLHEAERQNWFGNRQVATEMAHHAAEEFVRLMQKTTLYLGGDFSFTVDFEKVVHSLLGLEQVKDAALAAEAALQVDSANPALAELASQVQRRLGNQERAKELATIAVFLKPGEVTYLRHLAEICESLEDWRMASRYRRDCLEQADEANLEDQVAYARAALNADDLDEASRACEQILSENPDDGRAHGLLGVTRTAQNRDEEAILHLNRATLIAPEEDEWWLALARQYQKQGDERTALETLRAAVLAAPDSGEIHYHLGEMYLAGRMNSEALPHLKQAATLKPENPLVAFRLARALHALGYLSEARQVIEGLRDHWARTPEIAFEYAEIALALDDVDAALPAFEIATQSEEVRVDWLLTYATLLLNDHIRAQRIDETGRYQRATALLEKALTMAPGDLWASILLAEALRKDTKYAEAYELYQQLVELPEVAEKGWLWRIQHGYGLSAIGLGQGEAGITMLQEAANGRPDSLEVVEDLTTACLSANLDQDAEGYAERALEIAPGDHHTLDWFSKVMVRLGRADRAAEALRCAIELSPEQGDVRVRYAQLALENGNVQDASDALRKLPELNGVTPEVLRQAAYLLLRMQEPLRAMETLEKAVFLSDRQDADLLSDLARVYSENGRVEDAIQTVQRASESKPGIHTQVLHADLLAKQKRYQAAMLVVERALKQILTSETEDGSYLPGIYARSASWSRELGNVASAFEQAEKALEFDSDDLSVRFLATNLATALLLKDKAAKYALLPFEALHHQNLGGVGVQLAGLSGHLAIENERLEDAQSLYDVCARIDGDDLWVRSLNARLLARQGEVSRAADVVQGILSRLEVDQIEPGDATLWVARAAFEAYLWQESFRLYDTLISKRSMEVRGAFDLCRAMVEAAETQQLCVEVGVQVHAPGIDAHSEHFQGRFDELMGSVQPYLPIDEVKRWNGRAQLVMGAANPGAWEARSALDAAAMMTALRGIKNLPAALRAGKAFADENPVLAQQALCLADEDPLTGLEAAEKLTTRAPEHPLYLALDARLAQKAGDAGQALQSIETALHIWPDEATWHAWAAELALQVGDLALSLQHWKEARTLQPGNADFATQMGRVLTLQGDYPAAAEMLSKAVELTPEKSAAWLGLAQAQKGLGRIEESIQSALKAGESGGDMVGGFICAAQICQEAGRAEQALDYARSAYHSSPMNPRAIVNLSRTLNAQGKAVESLELIGQSLEDLEPDRELFYERARLVYRIQGAAAAGALVDQLIEDYPDDPDALALHATVQADLGQLKVAERSAFRSLRLQPHQPGLALALARMNRKAGQLDQAVHLLGQVAGMDPHNVEVYLELGQAYIDRREHHLALQAFEKATQIAPRDPRGYFQSALILKETKDYPGAEAMLEQAARYAPEDLAIHRQLVGVMALNLIHKSQEASKAL